MLLVLFWACRTDKVELDDTTPSATTPTDGDADDDGVPATSDCDDADPSVGEAPLTYADADADGHGAGEQGRVCDGDGRVEADGDCDDGDDAIHPGAAEVCNDVDDDCDGEADEEGGETWYDDVDGDGYGDPQTGRAICSPPPILVLDGTDCDDADATAYPGAPEVCDGDDEDCDGEADDGVLATWWSDADGDGWGVAEVLACELAEGLADAAGDCDDADVTAYPGAPEVCDGADDDCDGAIDEDVLLTFYEDADGDGWGDAALAACEAPAGYVALAGDCDDGDAAIGPGADEVCDDADVDEDCDGLADDDDASVTGTTTAAIDLDGDLYTDIWPSEWCTVPAGYTAWDDALGWDCDDGDPLAWDSFAAEVCDDGGDNDCDGDADLDDADCATTLTIAADVESYVVADALGYPTDPVRVEITVASGVTVSSASTGEPAFTTDGLAAGSIVVLTNLGTIHGRGGDGACGYGGDGEDGGDAIEATVEVVIDNGSGAIYGGGGGGGAGDDPGGGGGGAGGGLGCDGGGDAIDGTGGYGGQRFGTVAGGDPGLYDGSAGTGGTWGNPGTAGGGGSGGAAATEVYTACCTGQGGAGGGWGGGGGG
ncbi:MAG: MopE-related protein, partial [Myxococcota bacterium]